MELQKKLMEDTQQLHPAKERIPRESDSIQYNAQDLDQEQRVDVNPFQLNTQNFHIHVENNYSGKITGITCFERSKEIAQKAEISLYFGLDTKYPVYRTNSDHNGNFIIEDLPPGYYTIGAELGTNFTYLSNFIKLLPCQNVNHLIHLKQKSGSSEGRHF